MSPDPTDGSADKKPVSHDRQASQSESSTMRALAAKKRQQLTSSSSLSAPPSSSTHSERREKACLVRPLQRYGGTAWPPAASKREILLPPPRGQNGSDPECPAGTERTIWLLGAARRIPGLALQSKPAFISAFPSPSVAMRTRFLISLSSQSLSHWMDA